MVGESVVIVRSTTTTTDRYGNPVPGDPTRVTVRECAVAPRSLGDAAEGGRVGVVVGVTVYFPPRTDVVATDQLEVRGELHDIDGDVGVWLDPWSGESAGVEVSAKRVEG